MKKEELYKLLEAEKRKLEKMLRQADNAYDREELNYYKQNIRELIEALGNGEITLEELTEESVGDIINDGLDTYKWNMGRTGDEQGDDEGR